MKAFSGAGAIAPTKPKDDRKALLSALLIIGVVLVFAILSVTLVLHSPSPERCVAIFQNIATLFFLLCLIRIVGSARLPCIQKGKTSTQILILPLAAGALVWADSISTYFISDDFEHLRAMSSPLKSIAWNNFVLGQAHTFIRPIGFLSLAVDYRLFHLWAPGYHIVSLLLHLAAVAGIFFLCRELGLPANMCAMAALFFSVLPINAEAIVWMACRFDQIATPLMIWSVYAYTRFRASGNKGLLFLALLLFVVAAFSKESAYALPVIVLLLETAVLRPQRWLPVTVFFGSAAASFLYRWFVLGGIGGYREASGASSALHINVNTLKGLFLRAPAETIFGLNWFQPPKSGTLLIASGIATLMVSLCIFAPRESRRLYGFAIGWILIAPIPAHSQARVGADLVNSRELYFASAGAAILLALLVSNIVQSRLRTTACILLTLLFTLGAWHNLAAWRFDSVMSRWLPTKIMALYPHPATGTEFQINGLPRSFRGIYFYQTGLNTAVQLAYGRADIMARRTSDPESSLTPRKTVVSLCFRTADNEKGELVPCSTGYRPALSP